MGHFDHDYLARVADRLLRLQPGSRPRWGELTHAGVVQHLHGALRYSLGDMPLVAPVGSFTLRWLIGPRAINGFLRVPRNTQFRRRDGSIVPIPLFPGGVPELITAGERFASWAQMADWRPPAHPAFGDLGRHGWSKLHYRHFEHHLGQFGV